MITIRTIAYKNLLRKKTRTILTVVGIALSAWVLLSLFGFNRGYESALNKDIDNMGFQIMVTAKGCPYEAATLMLKGGTGLRYMNEDIMKDVLKHQEVKQITPMLMQAVFDPNKGESGGMSAYLGVDPTTIASMKGFLEFKQGAWFTNPEGLEVVMGYEAAELEQREAGDLLLVTPQPGKSVELKVVGILKRTGTQDDGTIFIPLKTLQRLFNNTGKITSIGVKVQKEADIAAFEEKLYQLPDVQVVSLVQVKRTIISLVATARVMVLSIAVIAILIAMIGVINTILMSVYERYQEIGIIKSMGAMPGDVFRLVWIETMILCLVGGVIGNAAAVALAQATDVLIKRLLPYTPTGSIVQIDATLFAVTTAIIVGVGILSGLYPAWKASRVRPLEAIRGEVS